MLKLKDFLKKLKTSLGALSFIKYFIITFLDFRFFGSILSLTNSINTLTAEEFFNNSDSEETTGILCFIKQSTIKACCLLFLTTTH